MSAVPLARPGLPFGSGFHSLCSTRPTRFGAPPLAVPLPESTCRHILGHVITPLLSSTVHGIAFARRIPEILADNALNVCLVAAAAVLAGMGAAVAQEPGAAQREVFSQAWQAGARGDRAEFEKLMPGLQGYLLYPYLQYEDLRQRRAVADEEEMAGFLGKHADWAFAAPLESAWLRSLASREQWDALLAYGDGARDTEVRCAHAQARIRRGKTDGLLPVAQSLWNVGRSQPDSCDAVFAWLQQQGGITPGLAWQRIQLSMEAREPRLARYLGRFLPENERIWVDRWYRQDRGGYQQLGKAQDWPDEEKSRDIVAHGLQRLARGDPDRAWSIYEALAGHIQWPADQRHGLLREIALWSAVNGSPQTPHRMQAVPGSVRDDRLLEWWVRQSLASGAWQDVPQIIAAMSPETAAGSRWRYWRARALLETGVTTEARALLAELAQEANYHGFMAADLLQLPYVVCPEAPAVSSAEIESLGRQARFQRSLELRKTGVVSWSRSEWVRAARDLDKEGLRIAAGLAVREDWPEMAIAALGDSGDWRWYEWRFPLNYSELVDTHSSMLSLDPAWVMGLMRSESAMAEDALSTAGARGLMQLTPDTARQLARQHGFSYEGREQLLRAADNVLFGTTYLRDLLDRFGGNPVLVSGAYNAGPNAVERWLRERSQSDPAIWVETLPYFETRDYIPRVLAFATIYDWRLQRPVMRISSRMPEFDSSAVGGTMSAGATTEVVCRVSG
jgi:soluble lytic murein transglycosylase